MTPSDNLEPIKEEELKSLEELENRATPGPMYATCDPIYEAPDDDLVWTISQDPDKEGWCVDSNCSGYGLKRDDAKFYAACRNLLPRLIKGYRDLQQMLKISDGVYKILQDARTIEVEMYKEKLAEKETVIDAARNLISIYKEDNISNRTFNALDRLAHKLEEVQSSGNSGEVKGEGR